MTMSVEQQHWIGPKTIKSGWLFAYAEHDVSDSYACHSVCSYYSRIPYDESHS